MKLTLSTEATLLGVVLAAFTPALLCAITLLLLIDDIAVATAIALLLGFIISASLITILVKPLQKRLNALHDGLLNLADGDFSTSLRQHDRNPIHSLFLAFNRASESIRLERQSLYYRELLLDTVIQNASMSVFLTDSKHKIVYANHDARHLLNHGNPIVGTAVQQLTSQLPKMMRTALEKRQNGIFHFTSEANTHYYHVSFGEALINAQHHDLYIIKNLTKEVHKQEAETWKKVIRIISHELNNSLAPITSLADSGLQIIEPEANAQLNSIFATISERAVHLNEFMQGYARLAKLPAAELKYFEWAPFIHKLQQMQPFKLTTEVPDQPGFGDPTQIEHLLLNLLKNAHESGSAKDKIELAIKQTSTLTSLDINDRGKGMSPNILDNALTPFYTTKHTGAGIGLPLCREIVANHNGRLSFVNRQGGGMRVNIELPATENIERL